MADSMPTGTQPPTRPPDPPSGDAPDEIWTAFLLDRQAAACAVLGSRLYAGLLSAAADDVRAGGPAWAVLQPHITRDTGSALALRFMAAVHRLVLVRQAPALALHFPSVGGSAGVDGAWPALRAALADHAEQLSEWVGLPCQTNEVGRCAALVGGFLTVAAATKMPLRLLEIGASAGLNLNWDRYCYTDVDSTRRWGDDASPVQLHGQWDVDAGVLDAPVQVHERLGCDPHPLDPTSAEGRLALTAAVWADQVPRHDRLRGALDLAAIHPVEVAATRAIDWLPQRLAEPGAGVATVVYHSVVLQYLDATERAAVIAAISTAGGRASDDAPVFWLRMEPEDALRAMTVTLTAWPGGDEVVLATAGAHGNPVRWRQHPL